jgi:hypothetical protein
MQHVHRYLILSAAVFGFVAVAHLVRALEQWPLTIAGWNVANELSWLAALISASLSAWALSLRRHAR